MRNLSTREFGELGAAAELFLSIHYDHNRTDAFYRDLGLLTDFCSEIPSLIAKIDEAMASKEGRDEQ